MRPVTVARDHARLVEDWRRFGELAQRPPEELALRRPALSGWSVAEHLEHVARVDVTTLAGLERVLADVANGSPRRVTLTGHVVLRLGWIPRGRGKSPRAVLPRAESVEAVRTAVAEATAAVARQAAALAELARLRHGIRHPYFGVLGGAEWLRFLVIHHRHHEKIVGELRGG
jgi:hypothetical protein